MEVTKSNGKVVEIDCDFFADETVPTDYQWGHCFDMTTKSPMCPVFRECYMIYTRRREEV
jgi:hypothetical protein